MFRRNVGGIDRVARVIAGAILFLAGLGMLVTQTSFGLAVAIIGFLALMSGILGSCGLYIPFGFSTAHMRLERISRACCGKAQGDLSKAPGN